MKTSTTTDVQIVAKAIEKQAAPLIKKLSQIDSIRSNEDYEKAAVTMKALKEIAKESAEKRKSIIEPMNQAIRNVNSLFAPFNKRIAEMEHDVKALMTNYLEEQEAKSKKLEESFKKGDIAKPSTLLRKQAQLQPTSEVAVVRTLQKVKIEDLQKVPRKYMVPDLRLIEQALKEGIAVPGCTLETVKNIAL